MPLYNLVCPHCSLRCKTQHGRTRHIRAAHVNTLVNANSRNYEEQNNGPPDIIEAVPLTNAGPGAAGRRTRIEHPHLTGTSLHHVQGLEC